MFNSEHSKEGTWLSLGRLPLSPWVILTNRSVFVYPGPWATPSQVAYADMWFTGEALDHVIIWPLEGLETVIKARHAGAPCLCNWQPIKMLDTKVQVIFPWWQCSTCHTSLLGEWSTANKMLPEEGNCTLTAGLSGRIHLFPLLILICILSL